MILIFKKGESKEISENFNINEFHCQCDFEACYSTQLSIRFLASAQSSRVDFGKRIIVTSGNRCQLRNQELKDMFGSGGRVSKTSSHLIGDAADFTCEKRSDLDELEQVLRKHFKYVKRYKTHIHADTRLLK
jgi:hypothetical protein